MVRSYFIIALRNLRRQTAYSVINTTGLAVGIAVCALIFLWVRDELSYDRFHEKAERTYRVLWDARYGENEWRLARTPVPLAGVLREQFPDVESVVRFMTTTRTLRLGQDWVTEEDVLSVESDFIDVFTVPFVSGNPETALENPIGVVLTEEAARRYFPNGDAVGSSLELNDGEILQVTGVVEPFPSQSHVQFDMLVPLDVTRMPQGQQETWGSPPVYTYFVLREGASPASVSAGLEDFISRTITNAGMFSQQENRYLLPLQPLTDIHLGAPADLDLTPGGNATYVYLFSVIGIIILVLGCINFVNLATARAARRAKEVGVRKVLGSYRIQLIRQFLTESIVYVALALILSILLIALVLPAFNQIAGKEFTIGAFGAPMPMLALAGIAVLVTLLAGAYPAFVLSGFQPAHALRGSGEASGRRHWLRNGLVVVQFCISTGLIVGTLVVQSQLDFMQSRDLGFDEEHVLVVENANVLGSRYGAFRQALSNHPAVVQSSGTQSLPGNMFDSTVFDPEQPANYEESSVTYTWVDEGYVEVLGLEIVEGRNFAPARPTDSTAFLINQAAMEALGWSDPLGRTISMGNSLSGQVIGVVKDFHYESLHTRIAPVFLPFLRWNPSRIAVRLRAGNVANGISAVEQIWAEFVPERPFAYSFVDQQYAALYDSERQMARVFTVFAGLALFIACLGLFGLASYAAVQRRKEIGIRKVVGASVTSIVALLSADFLKLVGVAFLIGVPIAYVGMSRWLDGFAYRTEIGLGIFAAAGAAALLIALLTVSYQSIRAALTDPVKSIRYE